ncbi:hypothetical protein C5167_042078 [Papaver somniferum]|nr:hypothetical protein C5167_042078 [Papaver somniferum]
MNQASQLVYAMESCVRDSNQEQKFNRRVKLKLVARLEYVTQLSVQAKVKSGNQLNLSTLQLGSIAALEPYLLD